MAWNHHRMAQHSEMARWAAHGLGKILHQELMRVHASAVPFASYTDVLLLAQVVPLPRRTDAEIEALCDGSSQIVDKDVDTD